MVGKKLAFLQHFWLVGEVQLVILTDLDLVYDGGLLH